MKLRTFLGALPSVLMLVFAAGCVSGWLLARSTLSGWAMLLGWALLLFIVAGSVRECVRALWQRLGAEPEALRHAVEAMAHGNLTAVAQLPPPSITRSVCESLHELSQRLHSRVAVARLAAHRLEQALDEAEQPAPAAHDPAQAALLQARQALDALVAVARELQQRADNGRQRAEAMAAWGQRYADATTRLAHEQQLGQRRHARISEIVAAIETNAVQTHLLALQAAMEAGREGERSRGVQLIGNEVRVLSQRCRYAARQLRELVPAASKPSLAAEGMAGSDLPSMAGILQDQLAEAVDGARQLQQAADAASSAVAGVVERLSPLEGWVEAQQHADALDPALQETLRIEVEKVSDALSVFYLGLDKPALGSAVAPADAMPPAVSRRAGAKFDEANGRSMRADPFLTH